MFDSRVFHDKVTRICKNKGTTITQVAVSIGLSNAAPTKWKKGQVPSAAVIESLSSYLNVSADYLLSESDDIKYKPLDKAEIALLKLFIQLEEAEKYQYIGRLEACVEAKLVKPEDRNE